MASSPDFVTHCLELLATLGQPRAKRMFGGHGLYVDEIFVAVLDSDTLYLKTDATTQPTFEGAGRQAFIYESSGKLVNLNFWTVPDEAMESPELFRPWGRLAMEAALRARNKKPPARKTAASKAAEKKTAGKTAAAVKPRAPATKKKAAPARSTPSSRRPC
jgi:DNA transformation protein